MDAAAFEQDALALVDRLYATALRLTRNEADAQDLVQDTYLRAFRSAGQFEAGTNLRGWMFTILHNTFLNQRRDRGRSPIDADSEAVEQAPDTGRRQGTPRNCCCGRPWTPTSRRRSTASRRRIARRCG